MRYRDRDRDMWQVRGYEAVEQGRGRIDRACDNKFCMPKPSMQKSTASMNVLSTTPLSSPLHRTL